jgi:hypothetical protein
MKKIKIMEIDESKVELIINEVYRYYESEIAMQNILYVHPMFYNGSFSENNEYQPAEPEELMTKEEFIEKLNSESYQYRWNTALDALISYVSKQE